MAIFLAVPKLCYVSNPAQTHNYCNTHTHGLRNHRSHAVMRASRCIIFHLETPRFRTHALTTSPSMSMGRHDEQGPLHVGLRRTHMTCSNGNGQGGPPLLAPYGAKFSSASAPGTFSTLATCSFTRRLYSVRSWLYSLYSSSRPAAYPLASSRKSCTASSTCLIVMETDQFPPLPYPCVDSGGLMIDRQTFPSG